MFAVQIVLPPGIEETFRRMCDEEGYSFARRMRKIITDDVNRWLKEEEATRAASEGSDIPQGDI